MNIQELKKLIKSSTAVLVLEEGEPSFVIIDYKSYKDLTNNKSDNSQEILPKAKIQNTTQNVENRETELLDKLNKEILAIKNQIEEEERRQKVSSGELDL